MHDAQHVVAVGNGIDNDSDRENVKDLAKILALHIGLAVDGHDRLDASGNGDIRDRTSDLVEYFLLDLFDKGVALVLGEAQLLFDLRVTDRVKIA